MSNRSVEWVRSRVAARIPWSSHRMEGRCGRLEAAKTVCTLLVLFSYNHFMHLPFSDTQKPIGFSCWGVVKHSFIHSFVRSLLRSEICSSVVRAFAYGAMDRRIDHSWWTHRAISRTSQCSTTGVIKAVVCAVLSV